MMDGMDDFLKEIGWPACDKIKYFPGAEETTGFGDDFDTFYGPSIPKENWRYRIHNAIDRAGGPMVYVPIGCHTTQWLPSVGEFSILRLFVRDFEIRVWHFLERELNPWAFEAFNRGFGLPAGSPIGPAGNKGLSVGRTGRHTHTEIVTQVTENKDSTIETLARMKWGDAYDSDDDQVAKKKMFTSFPPSFWRDYQNERAPWSADNPKGKNILSMNRHTIQRRDYLTGKLCLFVSSMDMFDF